MVQTFYQRSSANKRGKNIIKIGAIDQFHEVSYACSEKTTERIGNLLFLSRAFIFKVEASRNSTRTNVISATNFTHGALMPDFRRSPVNKLANRPTETKTIGAEMADFADNFEKAPNTKTNKAVKRIMG